MARAARATGFFLLTSSSSRPGRSTLPGVHWQADATRGFLGRQVLPWQYLPFRFSHFNIEGDMSKTVTGRLLKVDILFQQRWVLLGAVVVTLTLFVGTLRAASFALLFGLFLKFP